MKRLDTSTQIPAVSHAHKLLNLLKERDCIDEEGLCRLTRLQKHSKGSSFASLLIDAGVGEEAVQQAIADLAGITFSRIQQEDVSLDLLEKLGLDWCKEHMVLPVYFNGGSYIASSTIDELFLTDDVRSEVGEEVGQLLSTRHDILQILEHHEEEVTANYTQEQIDDLEFLDSEDVADSTVDMEEAAAAAGSSPVVRIVSEMITKAVREDASDIHLEPGSDCTHIRLRIDGVLHDMMQSPKQLHSAIVSRIKILSNLDIAERRLPQDGRIRSTVLGRPIDLRVSTVSTPKGEKIVLRLLDDRNIRIGLEELGFRTTILDAWREQSVSPNGIILVTGPTGCGKTTTLYSSLQQMDRKRLNISTVEDPVEYELSGITQIQVHEKIKMSFSRALRALLRQDPDVILVGEIRDMETAQVAIQAAITGHLVLSTLHTNDAPSSLTRLINIGLEPFLVASAVNGVLAQRLARRVCSSCVEMKEPNAKERELLGDFEADSIPHAVGCAACRGSGYKGRLGLYELLVMDDELRDAIASNPTITSFRRLSLERGMENLRYDGLSKVAEGLTTIDEIYRLT